MVGNKKSLVDAMEKGINLREQILKLFRDYYHGGLMKLTVIGGGEPLPPFPDVIFYCAPYPRFCRDYLLKK